MQVCRDSSCQIPLVALYYAASHTYLYNESVRCNQKIIAVKCVLRMDNTNMDIGIIYPWYRIQMYNTYI